MMISKLLIYLLH